ncbi:hypothetical protein PAMA_006456 [Pampus argenteus]
MERETSGCGEGGEGLFHSSVRQGSWVCALALCPMRLQPLTQQQQHQQRQQRRRRRRHSSPGPERTEPSSLMFHAEQRSDTGGRMH